MAAGEKIKGITIVLDGETKGLDTALKGINDQSIKVTKELKEIDRALKFNPGNTELVAQKQEMLSNQIAVTTEKLSALKQAQGEVEALFKKGEIGAEEYREFRRQVETTQGSLNSYISQLSGLYAEQDRLAANTKRLETFFSATGKSIEDFADVLGTRTVNAIRNGTATADQLDAAINKIGKAALGTDTDLGKMKDALDQVDDGNSIENVRQELDKLGQKADETAEGMDGVGEAIKGGTMIEAADQLSGVGDKILDIGSKGLEAADDMQSATSKIKSYFNLTEEEAQGVGDVVKEVFEQGIGDSMDSVADAVITVKKNIKNLDNETLKSITGQAVTLDEKFGIDMNESMRGVNALITTFGMDAQTAMDFLARGTQNGLDKTNELGDNLAEYATLFEENGYSANEMFDILQAGLDGGAYNLDKVNDLVKEFGIRVSDGSIETAVQNLGGNFQALFDTWKAGGGTNKELFQMLGQEISNMSSEQEKASAISQIFGSLGEDAGTKVIEAMTGVEGKYQDVAGAAQKMADDALTPTERLEGNFRAVKDALAPIGEEILNFANTILPPLIELLQMVADWFTNLPGPVKTFIVALGGIVGILITLAPIIAGIIATIGILGPGITALAGPIGIAIAAIAAIIAIIMNWGSVVDWLKGIWEGLSGWLGGLWENIKTSASNAWNSLGDNISSTVENIKSGASEKFNALKDNVANATQGMRDTAGSLYGALRSAMAGDSEGLRQNLLNVWNSLPGPVQNAVSSIYQNTIGRFIDMKNSVVGAVQGIWDRVSGIWDSIRGIFSGELSFPHIKMPHLNVWGNFSLNPPSVPHFDIQWYAKGGVLTQPTIFGANGNGLLGGGEAGPEAVAPISVLQDYVKAAVIAGNTQLFNLLKALLSTDRHLTLHIDKVEWYNEKDILTTMEEMQAICVREGFKLER